MTKTATYIRTNMHGKPDATEVVVAASERKRKRRIAGLERRLVKVQDRDEAKRHRKTVGELSGAGWTKPHPIARKQKSKAKRKRAAASRRSGR